MLFVVLLLFAAPGARGFLCREVLSLQHIHETRKISFYPDQHQPRMSCRYIVSSPLGTRVKLSCPNPNLPPASYCITDRITVSKTGNLSMIDAVSHCGPEGFEEISQHNQLIIQLEMNNTVQRELHVCTISVEENLSTSFPCVRLLYLEHFQNRTISFKPDHYQSWVSCLYVVTSPNSTQVKLSCPHPNLPPREFCDFDMISVSRTGDRTLRDAIHHCGPAGFEEISLRNELAVQLETNHTAQDYYCTVSVYGSRPQNNTCKRHVRLGRNETRNIAFYPDDNEEYKSCRWFATSPPDTRLSVTCSYPYFPPGVNCDKDKITVYKKGVKNSDTAVYCGGKPFTELSIENKMTLVLEISKAVENGFFMCSLSVKEKSSDTNNCDHVVHLTSERASEALLITPNQLPHSCRYIVVSPPGTRIFLSCPFPVKSVKENPCLGVFSVYKTGVKQKTNPTEYCDQKGFADSSVSNELMVSYKRGVQSSVCWASMITPTSDGQECNCGRRNTARIIGGEKTERHEFPMLAAVANKSTGDFFCGATVISHKYALTAAHCVYNRIPYELILIAGAWDLGDNDPSKLHIGIDQIIVNQDFKGGVFKNEIALVHLNESLVFSRNIGPACLPFHYKNKNFLGDEVLLMGWGHVKREDERTDKFESVMSNISHKMEAEVVRSFNYFGCPSDSGVFCTINKKKKGPCFGDSGGPVLWEEPSTSKLILVGVHFATRGCGLKWNAETRVTHYLDWIERHAEDAKLCKE